MGGGFVKARRLIPALVLLFVLLAVSVGRAKTDVHNFSVNSSFGDRDEFMFEVRTPGVIRVEATWNGNAPQLALILNGPGQTGYYQRSDGSSPLVVTQQVTAEILAGGTQWKASIVNFSKTGSAAGFVRIDYPQPTVPNITQRYTSFDKLSVFSIEKTGNIAAITVDYSLVSGHNADVFVGAWATTNDADIPGFGYRPGRVTPANGRTRLELEYHGNSSITSEQIVLFLYEGGKKPFLRLRHDFPLNWTGR